MPEGQLIQNLLGMCRFTSHMDGLEERKKCIDCKGEHRTMTMKYPKRKEILNDKREKEKVTKTYSQTVMNTTKTSPTSIDREVRVKIFTCIMHLQLMNITELGTYAKELNKTLTRNNLPKINAQHNPRSEQKTFTKVIKTEQGKCTQDDYNESVSQTDEQGT